MVKFQVLPQHILFAQTALYPKPNPELQISGNTEGNSEIFPLFLNKKYVVTPH